MMGGGATPGGHLQSWMKFKGLHRLLEDFQDSFDDFSLDQETLEYIKNFAEQTRGPLTEISFGQFVALLNLLNGSEREADSDALLKELDEKTTTIAELQYSLDDLRDENRGLKEDITDLQRKDLENRRRIVEMERLLDNSGVDSEQVNAMLKLSAISQELQHFPINELRTSVTRLLDDVLGSALRIGQERLELYNKAEDTVKEVGLTPESLATAFDDMTRKLQINEELIQIYESMPPPDGPGGLHLLADGHKHRHSSRSRRWIQVFVFVFWSVFLWTFGILTSLATLEFLETSEWAMAAGLSPAVTFPSVY